MVNNYIYIKPILYKNENQFYYSWYLIVNGLSMNPPGYFVDRQQTNYELSLPPLNNILIIAPYGHCGLFYQSCNLATAIKHVNPKINLTLLTFIPYYKPPINDDETLKIYSNIFDNIEHTNIYYENLTIDTSYADKFNIIILPELIIKIQTVATIFYIPNIDVSAMQQFNDLIISTEVSNPLGNIRVIANNESCLKYMLSKTNLGSVTFHSGFVNYIPETLVPLTTVNTQNEPAELPLMLSKHINFLLIGGPLKNIKPVILCFYKLYENGINNYHLHVTTTNIADADDEIIDIPTITKYKNIKKTEIIDLYKNASIVIVSSKCEGLGLNLYEAISFNIPILTHKGYSYIVNDGINGLLCDSVIVKGKNVEHEICIDDLYNKLLLIINDKKYYEKLRSSTISFNKENYDFNKFAHIFYDMLITNISY